MIFLKIVDSLKYFNHKQDSKFTITAQKSNRYEH